MSGTLKPNNLLSLFNGDSPNGTWTLNVSDRASADIGNLTGWGIRITRSSCP
jgi:subtilisin-like proprotein convertase family protein